MSSPPDRPRPLVRLAAGIRTLTGWRRHGLALLLGLSAALAFEPFNLVPILVPAFAGLVWLVDGAARARTAGAVGWWFGVGHFALGLYWISISFLVEPEKYGWMIPFAVFGLAAGLAIFPAAATLAAFLCRGRGLGRVMYLAAAWTVSEWLRGHVLTGFPWNLMGNVWTITDETMQLAAYTGVYGLSLVTVLAAALPATLGDGRDSRTGSARRLWRRWGPTAAAAGLVVALWAGGAVRLAGAQTTNVPGVDLRIVQANIPQALKWRRDLRADHLAEQVALSRRPEGGRVRVVVWPETAAPYFLAQNLRRRLQAAAAVSPDGVLITGAPRFEPSPRRFWNSLHVLMPTGEIAATYDKHHLVPFGEYVPFRGVLNLEKITYGRTDFSPGPGPRTIEVAGVPSFSPLICYEAIFPGRVVDPARRPQWLLNVTNDAWFGASSGPYQHFAAARMRTVEEGLPMVRAANTGISAVVDPYGRVVAQIGLNRKGVLDAALPAPILAETLYARAGDAMMFGIVLIAMAIGLLASRQR